MTEPSYAGRFAPSPTGELHLGSLVAACASYLQAKSNSGQWLIRIDNIDPPREVPGSAQSIIDSLTRLGLEPDEAVLYQSSRMHVYQRAAQWLVDHSLAYPCTCSRKELPPGPYPGTCRDGALKKDKIAAIRLRARKKEITFSDDILGHQSEALQRSSGDFIIWRADDLPSYQLATAIDDVFQGITQVVRGADLLDSTFRQIAVQNALQLETPRYAHFPVVTVHGRKLSKKDEARSIDDCEPVTAVEQALACLGLRTPGFDELEPLWDWAIRNWSLASVPKQKSIEIGGHFDENGIIDDRTQEGRA